VLAVVVVHLYDEVLRQLIGHIPRAHLQMVAHHVAVYNFVGKRSAHRRQQFGYHLRVGRVGITLVFVRLARHQGLHLRKNTVVLTHGERQERVFTEIQSRGDVHRLVHYRHDEIVVHVEYDAVKVVAEIIDVGVDGRGNKKRVALINMVCVIVDAHADAALGTQHQSKNAMNGYQSALHFGVNVGRVKALERERKLQSLFHVFVYIYCKCTNFLALTRQI